MAKQKTSKAARQPKAKKVAEKVPRQLLITFGASKGKIEKIEQIELAGKRRVVSEAEFAALAGDNDAEDFCEALADAYAAGIRDGFEDALSNDLLEESGGSHRRKTAREPAGEQTVRSGMGQIILRRALRRGLARGRVTGTHNRAHDGP